MERGEPQGFTSFSMHSTETRGQRAFAKLETERSEFSPFALDTSQPEMTDPESAAKRLLHQVLESDSVRGLTAPKVDEVESEFKSLGVETVPLTGTSVVKFRQYVKGVPVYGSLVSVELGDANEAISINSSLATPDVTSHVANVSPRDALQVAGAEAGYGRELPEATPILNYYLDDKGKWHLAYLIEDVQSRKKRDEKDAKHEHEMTPLVFDYVVDALTGKLVVELPRTPSASAEDQATDELGVLQKFVVERSSGKARMRDAKLNIETYDFGFADPRFQGHKLPGTLVEAPWTPAAVSAHVNAAVVVTFLRDVLKRNNIDNQGGRLISSINCVDKKDSREKNVWLNAFWNGSQMVYGQAKFNGKLRSLASSLDVVAHEMFHGVTSATARIEYLSESGALNESYSDVFGILVSNSSQRDIGKWDWQIADGVASGLTALRNMADPAKHGQPKHMSAYVQMPPSKDKGGVHKNSGIHNFAAFKVMTAKDGNGAFLFKPNELAAMFYFALTQLLTRQSVFRDSRRAVVNATRSLFRTLPQVELDVRVAAVEKGFSAAGIS